MSCRTLFAVAVAAFYLFVVSGEAARAADCPAVPDVAWWDKVSHDSLRKYVARKHKGDWAPYIAKWERQKAKLQEIYDRGSAVVVTKDKIKLEGERLDKYIGQVNERIEMTHCLSREATASGKSEEPSDKS